MKKYLAHRGSWNESIRENTIPAFDRSYQNLDKKKMHGFECDFQQLKTSIPDSWVIYHDDIHVDLIKNEENISPQYEILLKNKGEKIPTLNDFCAWTANITKKIIINIEIKQGTELGLKFLIKELDSYNTNNNIQYIFSSFNSKIIKALLNMNVKIGCLIKTEKQLIKTLKLINKNTNIAFFAFEFNTYKKLEAKFKDQFSSAVYFDTYESFRKNMNYIEGDEKVKFIFIEDR